MPAVNATRLDLAADPEAAGRHLGWRRPLVWPSGARRRADRFCASCSCSVPDSSCARNGICSRSRRLRHREHSRVLRSTQTTPPFLQNGWWSCAAVPLSAFAPDGRDLWVVLDHEPGGHGVRRSGARDSRAASRPGGQPGVGQHLTPDYFRTLASVCVRGRLFTAQDRPAHLAWPSSTRPRHASTSAARNPSAAPSRSGASRTPPAR